MEKQRVRFTYGVTEKTLSNYAAKAFKTKDEFEIEMMKIVDGEGIDYLVLAGFMKILSPEFVRKYKGKIINIHPSLLPAFPGAHGIKDAFEANETRIFRGDCPLN